MVKFVKEDISVVFSEIPDEITLAINISNCPHHCVGCHSPYLRDNIGDELTNEVLDGLIQSNNGITCVCFMGEGKDPDGMKRLIQYLENKYPTLKRGLYSGSKEVVDDFYWEHLNYLKIGPYIEEKGPINKETTNQRMYKGGKYYSWCVNVNGILRKGWTDITEKFWKRKD